MKTFFVIFLIILTVSTSYSQKIPLLQENTVLDRENPKYQTSLEKFYKQRTVTRIGSPQVLEKEIADSLYYLGPGDQLGIHIFGEMEVSFVVTVSPEGSVAIPTIGMLKVAGLTLKKAKEKLKELINKNYHSSNVDIDLVSLRKFRVYLVGEVQTPGTYFAQATDRVSDIIEVSGGLKDWADAGNIQVRHSNGQVDTLNLLAFYSLGDKKNNSTVEGGDVIYVPAIDLTKPYVTVEWNKKEKSALKKPEQPLSTKKYQRKIYSLKSEETISEFLKRIAVLDNQAKLSQIIIKRAGQEFLIDLFKDYGKAQHFVLQNKDVVLIPDLDANVYVQGEVMYPGAYPYQVNLTAKDYAGMAGVIEKSKMFNSLVVIRSNSGQVLKGGDVIVGKGDIIVVPRKTRESVRDYLTIITPLVSILVSTYTLYVAVTKK